MTVSTNESTARYEGNGVTDTFAFSGRIFTTSDLLVDIITRATDALVETLSVEDYTVVINGAESASVIVDAGKIPSGTQDILIRRDIPFTQSLRLPIGTVFPASDVESGLDKAAIRDQQLSNSILRSLRYPDTISGITNVTLPVPEDGKALVFSGTTGAIVTSSDYIADAVSDATAAVTGTALITATSTTSLATTGTGNKTWTIQSGRGFVMGQRLRAASDDGTKINEGLVTSYSGTSLIINVDYVSGTGTHADWNISVAGDRGASGAGSGDMLASQNLNDVASKPTAFNTIKQAATDTNSGVVELSTDAEAIAGTDTGRAITPANLNAVVTNQSMVRVGTSNGNGSTNTSIRRFTTTHETVGTDITYADSATLGGTFTINADGVYAISYTDSFSIAADFGISKNSNQLTTQISSITAAHQLVECTTGNANFRANCATTVTLAAGDVIRAHLGGASTNGSSAGDTRFTITRII